MEFNCTVYHLLALWNLIGLSSKYAMANADDCSHIIAHLINEYYLVLVNIIK